MAGADAGQRLEAMSTVRTGCNFAVPNRPAVSTPAATTCWRWYQSLAAGGLIYDHVSTKLRDLCAVDVSRSHALEWPWPAYHAPLAQVQRAIRGLGAAQPILRDVFRRGDVTGGAWWHQCRDVSSDQRGRWNGAGRLP